MNRRVVSSGDGRIVVQQGITSGPSLFSHFFDANASFVDKSLAIEAFLRDPGSHHLILRPRRCGKSFTLSMIRLSSFQSNISVLTDVRCVRAFLERPLQTDPHYFTNVDAWFEGTAITDKSHNELWKTHFRQYPVLYIDLKVN
jgi:hypothetical protein